MVLLKGRVECEHHVKRLHKTVVDVGMNWDVQNIACYPTVVSQGKVDVFTWRWDVVEEFLDFRRPDLHE